MRKIQITRSYDDPTDDNGWQTLYNTVTYHEDAAIVTLPAQPAAYRALNELSSAELLLVVECDIVLQKNGLPPLTKDEIVFLIDPVGWELDRKIASPVSVDRLQELSGFTVEKTIHAC